MRIAYTGERIVAAALSGKAIRVIGSPNQLHSFTYVPDAAAATIRAAVTPELRNSVLHAPTLSPLTQRELILVTANAAGVTPPKVTGTPGWALSALGRFNTGIREIAELSYQFERPFVMSSTASEEHPGMTPTPLDEALSASLTWWRTDPCGSAPRNSRMSA